MPEKIIKTVEIELNPDQEKMVNEMAYQLATNSEHILSIIAKCNISSAYDLWGFEQEIRS